ncbi:MAG: hypothetical protein ACTHQ3_10780 [Motilibacteraceae bacterium]
MTFDAGRLAGSTRSRIAACAAGAAGLLLGYLVTGRGHSFQLTAAAVVVLLLALAVVSAAALGVRAALRACCGLAAASTAGYLVLGIVTLLWLRATSQGLWAEKDSLVQPLLVHFVLPAVLFALAAVALLRSGAGPLVPARRGGPVLVLAGAAAGAVAVSVIQLSEGFDQRQVTGYELAALLLALALAVAAAVVCRIPLTELLTLLAGTVLLSAVGLLLVLMELSRTVEVVGLRGLIPAAAAAVVALAAAAVVRRSAHPTRPSRPLP